MKSKNITFLLLLLWGVASICHGQTSASYRLTEYTFNNGGNPSPALTSTHYRISFDALGDGILGGRLSSASYKADSGFVSYFPPPGEVLNLRFSNATTMAWTPEQSVGKYDVYWGPLSGLPAGDYGDFASCGLGSNTAADPSGAPPPGTAYFFLVSANNTLNEEGTLGQRSDGTTRANPGLCP